MKKVITRNILHKEIEIYARLQDPPGLEDPVYISRSDLFDKINRAKSFLIKEKKFKKGDTVILATTHWPEFLVWFLSVAELGGSFLVTDSPTNMSLQVFRHRLKIYKNINHIISTRTNFPIEKLNLEHIWIYEKSFHAYESSDIESDIIWAEEDNVLLYSMSSGTTDTPKLVNHSHKFFYDLKERNADIFNMKENDKCLHSKNLHHGSVLGVYLLPSLSYCRYHYHQPLGTEEEGSWMVPYIEMLKKYKINRCLMYWGHLLKQFSDSLKKEDFSHQIDIGFLAGFDRDVLRHICGHCGHRIISIFGCTETSGPLGLLIIDKNNCETVDFQNFGKPLDDFYKINLIDGKMHVTMPDGSVVCTGDRFDIRDENYIFLGRDEGIKIKGTPVFFPLIAEAMTEYMGMLGISEYVHRKNYDLIIDKSFEKLYIRSDIELDLEDLNRFFQEKFDSDVYNIGAIIVGPRHNFINGIKFDAEHIRVKARELLINVDK